MPRTGYRIEQINEFLRAEVADLIRQERDELHLDFVSVTEVQTSPDLRHARVYISTLGHEAEREAAVAVLRRHSRHLRRLLAPRITFRSVPELDFRTDSSLETGAAVMRAFHEVDRMRGPMPPDDAPLPPAKPSPANALPAPPQPRHTNPRARKRTE